MEPRYLGVTAPRVVAAPDSAASAWRWSLSRPWRKEGEAPDLRARAVSGRREGARRVSGRAAGPAAVWRAREKASWAAAQAEGKGEQRPGKEKGEGAGPVRSKAERAKNERGRNR